MFYYVSSNTAFFYAEKHLNMQVVSLPIKGNVKKLFICL